MQYNPLVSLPFSDYDTFFGNIFEQWGHPVFRIPFLFVVNIGGNCFSEIKFNVI
jgi:hypothetical protein